jgi:hypothetical protein
MAAPPTELLYPSPRAFQDFRGVRRQLVRLFIEGKAGLIDPSLLGRLIHCLNVLQNMDSNVQFEERLAALEQKLGISKTAKPNGHGRPNSPSLDVSR